LKKRSLVIYKEHQTLKNGELHDQLSPGNIVCPMLVGDGTCTDVVTNDCTKDFMITVTLPPSDDTPSPPSTPSNSVRVEVNGDKRIGSCREHTFPEGQRNEGRGRHDGSAPAEKVRTDLD